MYSKELLKTWSNNGRNISDVAALTEIVKAYCQEIMLQYNIEVERYSMNCLTFTAQPKQQDLLISEVIFTNEQGKQLAFSTLWIDLDPSWTMEITGDNQKAPSLEFRN